MSGSTPLWLVIAGRERDWEDIKSVVIKQKEKIDWEYLEKMLKFLSEILNEDPNTIIKKIREFA